MNSLDFSIVWQALPYLLHGLAFSLQLTVFAFLTGLGLGIVLALVRHLKVPLLAQLVVGYITLIRSIPLILVLFWFFFLVPILLTPFSVDGRPIPVGAGPTAFVTFSLFEAAYYAEIIRTGLRSLNKGQFEAAAALSLSTFKTYRYVIIPQVIRVVSPILLTQTIILFQDTSLVYVLSVVDLTGAAVKIAQLNGKLVEMYLVVALVYLAICSTASQAVAMLRERQMRTVRTR